MLTTDPAELKQQLVDCIRMLEQSDIIDYNGHCSIRLDDDRILINIGSCQRSRLTVDDICTIDLEGNLIEGKGNAAARVSSALRHLPRARRRQSDRACASEMVHVPDHGRRDLTSRCMRKARSSIRCRCSIRRIRSTTARWPIGSRRRSATGPAALMKSHGAVTVGKDIVEAFVLANYMEENAYRQYMALQIGKPYVFSEEEIALCREKLWNAKLVQAHAGIIFAPQAPVD